jgi:ABC-type multidrug transport system fused ATPase/permease subunit
MKSEQIDDSTPRIVWKTLVPTERRRLVYIWVLILLGMFLETFSLGLIIPFIGLLSQENYRESIPAVFEFFGNPSQRDMLLYAMVAIAVVYVLKSIFLYYSAYTQRRFIYQTSGRLTQAAFETYLRQPYAYHLERNSATLIRNVENARSIIGGGLDPALVLLTDGLVATGLFLMLLVVEPLGTLCVLVLFIVAGLGFQLSTRERIAQWGKARKFHAGKVLQHLQQGLSGAKEIKMLGRERKFLDDHEAHLKVSLDVDRRYVMLQSLPRLFFEAVAVVGLAVLVIIMVSSGDEIKDILPTLGLFAATAFRVMPSIGRVIASVQTIGYNKAFMKTVYSDSLLPRDVSQSESSHLSFKREIEVRNVSFKYASAHRPSLSGVNIKIGKGEAVGIIGASGAGKSTLVDVLLGLLSPENGEILVDGVDIQNNLRSWQDHIGYVPQTIYLVDDTLARNVAFGLPDDLVDHDAVARSIKAAQLDEFVTTLPDGINTIVGERGVRLSGGQRQRIGIARALYNDPEILVLDEATSSLDTETEQGVMDAVKELLGTKTIVIIAHRTTTVSYCTKVYKMDKAQIVGSGLPSEMTLLPE